MRFIQNIFHLTVILNICNVLIFLTKPPQVASCTVLLYADLTISETSYIFHVLLRQTGKCGCKIEWRNRSHFISWQEGAAKDISALILVASFGPSDAEKAILLGIPESQRCVIFHFSDEMLMATSTAIYGKATKSFRNYFHSGMDNSSLDYLLLNMPESEVPSNLWMPLGIANLKSLPRSFTYKFVERPLLWSWAGSTENKPERSEMLKALQEDADAERIMRHGSLHTFGVFAGQEGSSPEAMNSWQYSMIMQRTQFVPVPAGISAEQYRIWESIEAGCLIILLQHHLVRGSVLYPLHYLGFKYINLTSWAHLPQMLLHLKDDVKQRPRMYEGWQQHNNRLWAAVKTRIQEQVLETICGESKEYHDEYDNDRILQ